MDDPKKDQEEMSILEAQDGSATVDLPENMIQSDGVEENNDVQGQSSSNEEASIDQNESQDVSHDDEDLREAKRSRRRAKKDLIRKTNQEKDLRLQQLQRGDAADVAGPAGHEYAHGCLSMKWIPLLTDLLVINKKAD